MKYLTDYYKNRCIQLQEQIDYLRQKLYIAEGPQVAGTAETAEMGVEGPAGGPGGSPFNVAGSAGGNAGGQQFSGAVLGQLLATGNMEAVAQYLAQFYPNNPGALAAIMASLGLVPAGGAGGPGGSIENVARKVMGGMGDAGPAAGNVPAIPGGAYSGQALGNLLGSGNMDAVNQYLSQYQPQPADTVRGVVANAPRGARRGGIRPAGR